MKQKFQPLEKILDNTMTDMSIANEIKAKVKGWYDHFECFKKDPKHFMETESDFFDDMFRDIKDIRGRLSGMIDFPLFTQISDELFVIASSISYEAGQEIGMLAYEKLINSVRNRIKIHHREKPIGICTVTGTEKEPILQKEIHNLVTYRKISGNNDSVVLVTPSGQIEKLTGISIDEFIDEYYSSPDIPVIYSRQAFEFIDREAGKANEEYPGNDPNTEPGNTY